MSAGSDGGLSNTAKLELRAQATVPELLACLQTIGEFGAAGNLDRRLVNRLRLAVEELFSNTIKYGYGAEGAGEVRVAICAGPPAVLCYEDDAAAFDPTAWTPVAARDDTVGKAGLDMVLGLAASAAWEPLAPGNRLRLTFAPT